MKIPGKTIPCSKTLRSHSAMMKSPVRSVRHLRAWIRPPSKMGSKTDWKQQDSPIWQMMSTISRLNTSEINRLHCHQSQSLAKAREKKRWIPQRAIIYEVCRSLVAESSKHSSLQRHTRHILLCHMDSWSVLLVAAFAVIWIPIANTCNAKIEWCICQVNSYS